MSRVYGGSKRRGWAGGVGWRKHGGGVAGGGAGAGRRPPLAGQPAVDGARGLLARAVAHGRGSPNGGAYLDMTGNMVLPRSGPYFMRYLETCLPGAYVNARQAFSKPVAKCEEPWEVRPSAHYHMGGLRADAEGASGKGEGAGRVRVWAGWVQGAGAHPGRACDPLHEAAR